MIPINLVAPEYKMDLAAVPSVSASASRDKEGKLHLSIVNLDPNRPVDITTTLAGSAIKSVSGEVLTAPEAFIAVHEAVKKLGIETASAEIAMLPQNYVKLEGKPAQSMLKLMEALDDLDDIRHVWSNFDIEEKEIEASLA